MKWVRHLVILSADSEREAKRLRTDRQQEEVQALAREGSHLGTGDHADAVTRVSMRARPSDVGALRRLAEARPPYRRLLIPSGSLPHSVHPLLSLSHSPTPRLSDSGCQPIADLGGGGWRGGARLTRTA
jgi:hypothetical protein